MFYPADWRKDPELRVCSIAARGLWIDMIALMHEGDPYGHLVVNGVAVSAVQLARLVGEPVAVVRRLLAELESHNVFSRNEIGVAFSRRMVADEGRREFQAVAGRKGGSPSLGVEYNVPGYVYAMERSSDGAVKIGISTNPAKRLYRVRQQFPTCSVELLAAMHTDDMGATEAALHLEYAAYLIGGDGEWFALPTLDKAGLINRLKGNVKVKAKGRPPSSVAVAVSPSEGLAADAEPKGLDLLPKAVCDMGYEAFTKRLGAVNYGRFRKEILPIYQSRSADHPSGEELVQAVEAFVEARDADRPNFRTKYTVTLFASALHEYVRLGKMPLVNEWGEATERGRACGIGV